MPRACSSSSAGQPTTSTTNVSNSQHHQSPPTPYAESVAAVGDGDLPLPRGWDLGRDYEGKVYYIDHNTHATTWVDPRDSLTKPASFADCVGDELPVGWEQIIDYNRGVYFVNHVDKQVQNTDPRLEWRAMQEEMLRQYLTTAQEDLENKKELASVKEARLTLAQDEFRNLNSTLSSIHASNTSYLPPPSPDLPDYCNLQQLASSSTPIPPPAISPIPPGHGVGGRPLLSPAPSLRSGASGQHPFLNRTHSSCIYENDLYANSRYAASCTSTNTGGGLNSTNTGSNLSLNSTTSTTSTKYDPDLLKADVAHARARVLRLQRELTNIHSEVEYKSKGVETLNNVNTKFEMGRGLTPEEALAIRSELQNIQQSLVTGEQEKVQLMKSLACLKEELTRLEVTDNSIDATPISQAETLSIASQTDLTGEEMVPVGARLAELARLRLQYDESRRSVQELQQRLSSLEERIAPGQLESDNDRLLLIQEKEQLLRELRSIISRSRNKRNNDALRLEIRKLEMDLNQAMETSNRCIADRLKTHEEKQYLLHQLKTSMRSVTTLESKLRFLSASTLSMSSSSSLGSLGSSSHASSKGSLSSLSFTDIYGMSTTTAPDPNMLDLQRRVEKILLGGSTTAVSSVSSATGSGSGINSSISIMAGSSSNSNAMISSYMSNAGGGAGISFSTTGNSPTSANFPMLGNLAASVGSSMNMIIGGSRGGVSRNQSTEELTAAALSMGGSTTASDQNLSAAAQQTSSVGVRKTSSQLSLSPRSSLSSVSPPVSPYDVAAVMLPSYEQAYLGSQERQRRLHLPLGPVTGATGGGGMVLPGSGGFNGQILVSPVDSESGKKLLAASSSSSVNAAGLSPLKRSLGAVAGGGNLKPYHRDLELADLTSAILNNNNNLPPHHPPLLSSPSSITAGSSVSSSSFYSSSSTSGGSVSGHRRTTGQESVSSDQSAPLSPISESAILSDSSSGRLNPASRSVSAAVSDESVAGDSGVFEAATSTRSSKDELGLAMNLETAQIQIKLRYSTPDGLLHIGIEKARNLSVLFIPEAKKVCIKAALLPAIANVSYTFCTRALANLNKPNFGENFPVAISKPKLVTKTLQVNVWAIDPSGGGKDDCLGSAQVSLADFNCTGVSLRWYNVLSFHFMQPEVMKRTTPTPTPRSSIHSKQESEVSMSGGSRVGTLKEESSDESTIISSQTSTLTRNIGPESMHHHQEDVSFYPLEVEYEEDPSDDDEEIKVDVVNNFVYPGSGDEASTVSSSLPLDTTLLETTITKHHHHNESVDAETNTDCAYIQPPVIKGRLELGGGGFKGRMDVSGGMKGTPSSIVKRSKTFSPTAPINKSEYSCRLNRSDSDSAMPLYRRLPFQRSSRERRSLHFPSGVTAAAGGVGASSSGYGVSASKGRVGSRRSHAVALAGVKRNQTSLDLELDLAAQNSRLQVLKDEITRLKKIKDELEKVKDKGDRDLPAWIGEDTLFIKLIQNLEVSSKEKSTEEKKMEKLLRRTAKEIYKLRKTKNRTGQLDAQSFREKMAFLANLKSTVPILGEEECTDTDDEVELASQGLDHSHTESISPLSTSFTTTPTPTSMMMMINNLQPSYNSDSASSSQFLPHHHRPLSSTNSTTVSAVITGSNNRTIISLTADGSSAISPVSQASCGGSESSGGSHAVPFLRSGLSTETVDTLTEEDIAAITSREHDTATASSQNSTPTPGRAASSSHRGHGGHTTVERFVYEVDPELGAFV